MSSSVCPNSKAANWTELEAMTMTMNMKRPIALRLRRPIPWYGVVSLVNGFRGFRVRASMVNSSSDNFNFAKRIDQAWSISQQPSPIACSSCNTNGHIECKWCAGTGFFIIGDNMLCEVPSRNTTCVICAGEGSIRCSDCQGTGFRAKWLGKPQTNT